jgi:hypothetical protein
MALDLTKLEHFRIFEEQLPELLLQRWRFGLPIVNIVTLVWLLNRVLPPVSAKSVIEPMYHHWFDSLAQSDEVVHHRIGGLVVDPGELDLVCSELSVESGTETDLYTLATVLYHSRQAEYLKLLTRSMSEQDTLGPMGGIAFRFWEQLTGRRAESLLQEGNADEDFSPVEVCMMLTPIFGGLAEATRQATTRVAGVSGGREAGSPVDKNALIKELLRRRMRSDPLANILSHSTCGEGFDDMIE